MPAQPPERSTPYRNQPARSANRIDPPKRRRSPLAAVPRPGRQFARIEPAQTGQVVAAAGGAIVTAARMGRLLGRSGWRVARQLPGVTNVEHAAQRLRQVAAGELGRMLDMPQSLIGAAGNEEQRVMMLVRDAGADPQPLRTAMTELLERSTESDGEQSREYLFGTIVSQLVPDEARILAALATGRVFAAVDVVARQGNRGPSRPVLTNVSTVGAAAGVALPQNGPTYLNRLHGYGLVEFAKCSEKLDSQFESLRTDPAVVAARAGIEASKQGNAKVVRKSVSLSRLGQEFWAACAPSGATGARPKR